MATGGSPLSTDDTNPIANVIEQKLRVEAVVKRGASWFITVAVLSIVNSILSMSGAAIRFIFGLGIAQIVDVFAHQAGGTGVFLDLIINGFVAGIFVVFWSFARKGEKWAFVVGMVLYVLDGLILLVFKDILAVAFHAYALYRMYTGLSAVSVLRSIEETMRPAGAPIEPK